MFDKVFVSICHVIQKFLFIFRDFAHNFLLSVINFSIDVGHRLIKMVFDLCKEPSPLSVNAFIESICGEDTASYAGVDAFGFINDQAFSVEQCFVFILINDYRTHHIVIRIRDDRN